MEHNAAGIPRELKELDQWLGYKGTKAPRVAFGNYHLASYTNPETHGTYEQTLAAVGNGHLDGLGIAVTEFDPYVVIDLDGCRDETTGELSDFAQEIVDDLDTYTEVSNSGKGLHIIARSFVEGNYKASDDERNKGKAIEFFATVGFVILTGATLKGNTELKNIPRAKLQHLIDELKLTRKQVATYDRQPEPDPVDVPVDLFEAFANLGNFATLVITGHEGADLADRFPRDKDGAMDRSKVVFLAACNLREGGYDEATTLAILYNSDWVYEFLLEKADGWLWRYVVEPCYKSKQGEVAADALPVAKAAEFMTQADLCASLTPVDWLIEGILEANSVGLMAGKHSAFKSTLAIDWVHAIASGTDWLGHPCKQGAVVVIAGEGARGLARRAHAWGVEHELAPDALADLPVLWSKSAVQIMDADHMSKALSTINDMLGERYGVEYPELVVVDTLNKNFAGGDENSAAEVSLFFARLASAFPRSCVVVVHHFGKDASKGSRGSSALDAGIDFLYHVEASGGAITLKCQKMKDADRPGALYMDSKVIDLVTGDETTTGVTIGKFTFDRVVAEAVGVMRNDLQAAAAALLVVLEDMGDPTRGAIRGELIDALVLSDVHAETWDTGDRNTWRTQLGKLVTRMVEVGLLESLEGDLVRVVIK